MGDAYLEDVLTVVRACGPRVGPSDCSVRKASPSKCTALAVGQISSSLSIRMTCSPARPNRARADHDNVGVDYFPHITLLCAVRIV